MLGRPRESGKSVMKVGQYPPWSIEPEPSVKVALGVHLEDYKKGKINESQGYGVGAFAYYRRIVENLIDDLLNDIGELLRGDADHAAYVTKLADVRECHTAEAKIDVVKDLIPAPLRQGGSNPL